MQETRVLEICNQLGIGGTEKAMQIFCKHLTQAWVYVVACGAFAWWEREDMIKAYTKATLIANGNIKLIKKFIKQHKINVVHWHSLAHKWIEHSKSLELLKFCKNNWITLIETSPFSLYNKDIDNLLDTKIFVSKSNVIKYFWKFAHKHLQYEKYDYMYNPLDCEELEKYVLSYAEKIRLRKKYNIPPGAFVIGKVGRANLWKWDDTIIDIVPMLSKKISNLHVVIRALPKKKLTKIEKLWIKHLFTLLPESVIEQDVMETYQLMDIMMHTSRIGECNSVSINEWLFFWLPILTKSTDFMKKTIFDRDNGQAEIIENWKNGYVVNDIQVMVQHTYALYTNHALRSTISNNNIKKAKTLLDANKQTKQLIDIFHGKKRTLQTDTIKKYQQNVLPESHVSIIKENIKAVWESFFYK